MGILRSQLMNKPYMERVKSLLLTEMITRLSKNILRFKLRSTEAETVYAYKEQVVNFFNLLLGNSKASTKFWENEISMMLILRYGRYGSFLAPEERIGLGSINLRAKINKLHLFQSLQEKIGLRFCFVDSHILETSSWPFSNNDFLGVDSMVKLHTKTVLPTFNWATPNLISAMEKSREFSMEYLENQLQYILLKHGKESEEYVVALLKVAQWYQYFGDDKKTEQICEMSLIILNQLNFCSVEIAIGCYFIVGNVYKKNGKFRTAIKNYEIAKACLERNYGGHLTQFGGGHPFLIIIWKELASCLIEIKNFTESKSYQHYIDNLMKSYPKDFFLSFSRPLEDVLLFDNPSRVPFKSKESVMKSSPREFQTGKLFTFGKGDNGQLGHGDCSDQLSPCFVNSLKSRDIVKVVCGDGFTNAISSKGELFIWGFSYGQFGGNQKLLTPTLVEDLYSHGTFIEDIICISEINKRVCCTIPITSDGEAEFFGKLSDCVDVKEILEIASDKKVESLSFSESNIYLSSSPIFNGFVNRMARSTEVTFNALHEEKEETQSIRLSIGEDFVHLKKPPKHRRSRSYEKEIEAEKFEEKKIENKQVGVKIVARDGYILNESGSLFFRGKRIKFNFAVVDIHVNRCAILLNEFGEVFVINRVGEKFKSTAPYCPSNIVRVSCGVRHFLALTSEGNVYYWKTDETPHPISFTENIDSKEARIVDIASGDYHCVALDDRNEVWTFGYLFFIPFFFIFFNLLFLKR